MTTYELCKQQIDELKQRLEIKGAEKHGKCLSQEDLIKSIEKPDSIIHRYYEGVDFTDDDFWCTAGKFKLEYYVDCFERDLVLYINPDEDGKFEEAKIYEILNKAYDYWCLGEDEVSCVCCEEYMCDCLREIGIDFLWAEYEEEEDD